MSDGADRASARPWRLSDSDPTLILDADGLAVCRLAGYRPDDVAVPSAALIVAAVNALVPMRPGAHWLSTDEPPKPMAARVTGGCARPLEHAAGCECGSL